MSGHATYHGAKAVSVETRMQDDELAKLSRVWDQALCGMGLGT